MDNIALVVTRVLLKESLKNVETKANTLITKIRRLGLKVKPLKIEVIVYHRIRIKSPIRGEIIMASHTVKTS